MSDSSLLPKSEPKDRPQAEPPSPTAPALPRGQSLWTRLKAMFAFRTISLRDDLEVALEAEAAGETADFSPSERTILQNVLSLGEKHVEDVMVPRADIEAIDIESTLGDMIAKFRFAGHSRIPVYADNIDNITGFIHVKDALRRITEVVTDPDKDIPVKLVSTALKLKLNKLDIARTVLFVPPLMPVGDLLQQMQLKRVHMAIVIDEYGGTDGVVTIEDLLEAVVGEIDDEHDEIDGPLIRKINSNIYIASARAELGEVEGVIGPDFNPGEHGDEVDTIGGLVFVLAGHVPVKGETIGGLKNFEFEVLQADSRQLRRIKIKRLKQRKPPTKAEAKAEAVEETKAAG
ncbi:MAG: HlyC/CorC family transporter [Hyphomicrobiales bacterium]|nr:MAG: HlyC/CorC family transporter [Hyphomicrobiales bacterium]